MRAAEGREGHCASHTHASTTRPAQTITRCVTVLTRYRHSVRVFRKGEGHCASQASWLALSCARRCATERRSKGDPAYISSAQPPRCWPPRHCSTFRASPRRRKLLCQLLSRTEVNLTDPAAFYRLLKILKCTRERMHVVISCTSGWPLLYAEIRHSSPKKMTPGPL